MKPNPKDGSSTLSAKKVALAKDRVFWLMLGFLLVFLTTALVTLFLCCREQSGSEQKLLQSDLNIRTDRRSRPPIVDRNGEIIATNIALASVYIDTRFILSRRQIAQKIHMLFPDLNESALQRKIASQKAFVWIKRNLTPSQEKSIYELGIPGLNFLQEHKRVYPNQRLLSHVLGSVDIDNRGIAGVEYYLDSRDDLGKGLHTAQAEASPLALSIDLRAQYALYDELRKAYKEFRAIGAAGLLMNVHSGEILALVSLPDFDPNPRTYAKASGNEKFNRVTLGSYEMGSTMKVLTLACALEAGSASQGDQFDVSHPIHFGRFVIHDYHPYARPLSLEEIFVRSSNIGMAQLALKMGIPTFTACMEKLSIFSSPSLEMPEIGRPILPKKWTNISLITASYGHGFSVPPLQALTAFATVVNGGYAVRPTLLRQSHSNPGGEAVFSQATSELMRTLLRKVVTEGTGRKAYASSCEIIGKTGTAEKIINGRYVKNKNISSFVSAFPAENPQYVMYVMFDEPQATSRTYGYTTAGWNAVPVSAAIVERIAPILNIFPKEEEIKEERHAA